MSNKSTIDETVAPGAKPNGAAEEVDEGYFTKEAVTPSSVPDIDLEDYRSGKPLNLTEIATSPTKMRIEVRKPRKREWFL